MNRELHNFWEETKQAFDPNYQPKYIDQPVIKSRIDFKGEMPAMINLDYKREFADIKMGYGSIVFQGSEEEYLKFIDALYVHQRTSASYFKIIGMSPVQNS